MNPHLYFDLCFFLTSIVCSLILLLTRGIVSEGPNSDGYKHIQAASHVKHWVWLSDMHKYAGQKAWFKDVGVLGLVLLQRLLRDKTSYYPVVVMCTLAHAASTILIYLVAENYWGAQTAFLLSVLYLFCFWPYQVLIQGGYQVLALFFFLAAIYSFQTSAKLYLPYNLIYFALGGVFSGLMMFASASSRKFVPVLIAAWVHSLLPEVQQPTSLHSMWQTFRTGPGLFFAVGISLTTMARPFLYQLLNAFVRQLYISSDFEGISKVLIKHKDRFSLEHYQQRGIDYLEPLCNMLFVVMLYGFASRVFSATRIFYLAHLLAGVGFVGIFILFMSPRFITNLKGLFTYWTICQWGGHFRAYTQHFAKRGMSFKEDMRGIGWGWYPRFVWRVIPFHMVMMALLGSVALILSFQNHLVLTELGRSALVTLIGLSPWIYGEITGCTQFGRTYFPGFVGVLLCLGYWNWRIATWLAPTTQILFLGTLGSLVTVSTLWNSWIFLSDVWPGRMAPTWLLRQLRRSGIREIYSYDTCYNNSLLRALDPSDLNTLKIHWIKSLDDVEQGYVVVPCTSSKSVALESDKEAIANGDFRADARLNALIDSRDIQKYAIAGFKTVGCSRMWVQEGEVPSYRDLILKEVGPEDRWRGHAWLLDASKLR